MAVIIGHASIDERGKANSGQAGDQTGREVCTRSWYNKGWTVLIRAKDPAVAERMAKACEAGCANPRIGYDQYQRNTLRTQARAVGWDLSKITVNCETDCSAFMTVCAEAAGIDMDATYTSGNAPVTWNMRQLFVGTGAFTAFTDSKYLTSDKYLRRGDILVYEKGHTAMVLSNGELSGNTSSTPAAQTTPTTTTTTKGECEVKLNVLKKGSKGEDVKAMQILLIGRGYSCGSYGADGDFGSATDNAVRAYQKAKGLTVDGIAGPATMAKLLGV